jgi:aminoglycoside phosphotransferase (APT) family kinase protein
MVPMEQGPTPPMTDMARSVVRARPPDHALRWLVAALGATEVVDIKPMPGSSTCAMHKATLQRSTPGPEVVVLRRYVLDDVLAEAPDIVAHETTALRLAATASAPVPELLAADPDGHEAGAPTVVMSWLDGRPEWEPRDRRGFLAEAAGAMADIAAVEVPGSVALRPIGRYRQMSYDPPRWATQPWAWERAVEIFHGPVPADDVGFVHRDFHPGNLLWSRGHLSGVVDWQSACLGPSSIDPGHCRLNMLYYDAALADELRQAWEQRSGRGFDPWADIMSIIGVLDHLRKPKEPSKSRLAIEDALARAVAALGG